MIGASLLITGGTGFFGRGFAREALNRGAHRVCIYSRGEFAQAQMREQFGNDTRLRWFVGDVRDQERLRRAMEGVDVVVHGAALKRIEVGYYCPDEMVKTNVMGAMNVIEASHDAKVQKVVALSTDKAYQPVSAYGHSKALAETLFLTKKFGIHGPKFAVTRYGNVSGSTGSVIPKWRELLRHSDIVPMTDPACTRFWMTEAQAVELVINTIGTMEGEELVIPDLPAFRISDLAEAMGAKKWDVRGLPAWEKLHESMCEDKCSETARRMSVEELKEALQHV